MGKTIYNVGDKFGNLTFKEELPHDKDYRRYGLFTCQCGNEVKFRLDYINAGKGINCKQCSNKEKGKKITQSKTKDDIKIGDKYNRLTVYEISDPIIDNIGRSIKSVICLCDCGKKTIPIKFVSIKNGYTKSCGCLRNEDKTKYEKMKGKSPVNKTHGDSVETSPHYYLHILWMGIKQKCNNPNNPKYTRYGGRKNKPSINVYKPWINDYIKFKTWILENLGERPNNTSLDRMDNDGNYEPNNLKWSTRKEQANNRERELLLNVKGRKRSLSTGAVKKRYEKYYKVKVKKGYQVHHIDWNRDNNNPDNLLDVTTKQHGWLHRMENKHLSLLSRDELIEVLKNSIII